MTNRVRVNEIKKLETQIVAAKLAARGWLMHAATLTLQQIHLCEDGIIRERVKEKLANSLKMLEDSEMITGLIREGLAEL